MHSYISVTFWRIGFLFLEASILHCWLCVIQEERVTLNIHFRINEIQTETWAIWFNYPSTLEQRLTNNTYYKKLLSIGNYSIWQK